MEDRPSLYERVRRMLLGKARSPLDHSVFHTLSLVAFFAWVGLGADGLSSICYGPEEAYKALRIVGADGQTSYFPHLIIFVAFASAATVFIISASYTQIIEQFPSGGGGYVVASKLLSPTAGMVCGCALLLDYVLTIAISIASGADALFSFLPPAWHDQHILGIEVKVWAAVAALLLLTLMNLRGVKESVIPLVPIFLVFVITHIFVIGSAVFIKVSTLPTVVEATVADVNAAATQVGWGGLMILLLRAYSLGAGTYTGIEAVSNGLPILREPREVTGKRTMRYMAASLAIAVVGLMLAYVLFDVQPEENKTLNAVLFERFTARWDSTWAYLFVMVTLLSEVAILFIAAQAGFLGGPRVLVNMALDRWFPHRFAMLSDRLVSQNGVLLMAGAALVTIILTRGSVGILVVLYSINVFITFVLSQLGMVKYWSNRRSAGQPWRKGLAINGVGLILCSFILVTVTIMKFGEGGWITILFTGGLVLIVWLIRRHYQHTHRLLGRLDGLVRTAEMTMERLPPPAVEPQYDPQVKTAVLLVNGFNGLGLHTLLNVMRLFPGFYKNFVFVKIGVIDSGNFKGADEVSHLREHSTRGVQRYVDYVKREGFYAEAFTAIGVDVVDEIAKLAPDILERFPQSVFFGGQLVFPVETWLTRWLHNNTVFALQRRFYARGIPVVVLPIRV